MFDLNERKQFGIVFSDTGKTGCYNLNLGGGGVLNDIEINRLYHKTKKK